MAKGRHRRLGGEVAPNCPPPWIRHWYCLCETALILASERIKEQRYFCLIIVTPVVMEVWIYWSHTNLFQKLLINLLVSSSSKRARVYFLPNFNSVFMLKVKIDYLLASGNYFLSISFNVKCELHFAICVETFFFQVFPCFRGGVCVLCQIIESLCFILQLTSIFIAETPNMNIVH